MPRDLFAQPLSFGGRILDLLPSPPPKGAQASLGDKLGAWWQLADFKTFNFEVAKRFKPTSRCASATTGKSCF
jgi:hypothetical protein